MNNIELRTWRKAHKLTQPELARELDVHPLTVSRWERGLHPIPHLVPRVLATMDRNVLLTTAHREIQESHDVSDVLSALAKFESATKASA